MSNKIEMNVNADLKRAMTSFKTAMNKKYADGSGSIFSHDYKTVLPSISSGSAKLDALLGNEGWALGRVHEIFGDTGSGKSSIVTMTCANARKQYPEKYILYFDAEQAQSFSRMKKLGLDCENDEGVIFVQEQSAEAVFDILDNAVKTGGFSLVIIDSIPAMMTERELKGDFDKETMAEKARFLSKSLPKVLENLKKAGTALIFVNQVRDKMDMWGGVTTPGGRSVPFYSSSRVKITSTPSMRIKDKEDKVIGQTIRFEIIKNKVGEPFGVTESNFYFGLGFNHAEELVDAAIDLGIIAQGGAWFTLHDGERIQGRRGCYDYYSDKQDKLEELRHLVNKGEFEKIELSETEESENEDEPKD